MSLINDALKKAQRQRGEPESSPTASPTPPLTGAAPAHRAPRRKPPGFETQMLLIGGGAAVVIVALVVALVVVLRDKDEPRLAKSPPPEAPRASPPPPSQTKQPEAQVTPAPTSTPPPPAVAPKTDAPAPAPTQNPASKFSIDPAPVAKSDTPRSPDTAARADSSAPPAAAPSLTLPQVGSSGAAAGERLPAERSLTPPRASSAMATAIEAFRVAGIRASGSDPRVLMNDRVFRVNDIVDHALGIRLTGVQSNALTFTDVETGAVYTRHF
jgi:hypothetical protein